MFLYLRSITIFVKLCLHSLGNAHYVLARLECCHSERLDVAKSKYLICSHNSGRLKHGCGELIWSNNSQLCALHNMVEMSNWECTAQHGRNEYLRVERYKEKVTCSLDVAQILQSGLLFCETLTMMEITVANDIMNEWQEAFH